MYNYASFFCIYSKKIQFLHILKVFPRENFYHIPYTQKSTCPISLETNSFIITILYFLLSHIQIRAFQPTVHVNCLFNI